MEKKTIKQLIGQYDKKQLEELVCCIVNKSTLAQQELLEYCEKNNQSQLNSRMIVENKIKHYWKSASKTIKLFDMYGGGSESDEEDAYNELEKMCNLFEENEDVSWQCKKVILDEMLKFVSSDNSGFTDYLVDVAMAMCNTQEENLYLADFLSEYANSYYRGLAANIYLENGKEDKYLEGKLKNLQYSEDYLELAGYYKKKGDHKQALNIVLKGLDRGSGRLDNIYQYLFQYYKENNDETALEKLYNGAEKRKWNQDTITELMYQYYKEKDNYEKQKDALIRLFEVHRDNKLYELYQLAKKELKFEDFIQKEKSILQIIKKRKLVVYFDILIDKEQTEEVIEYLVTQRRFGQFSIDNEHYFTKRLVDRYPREVLEIYWSETQFFASLGKKENYIYAVKTLKAIKRIMMKNKWIDEWNRRYDAFICEHKRKRLLMEEVEKIQR